MYQDEDYDMMEEDAEEEVQLSHAEHKENGNSAYKAKDYRGAIMHYTLAIETATNQVDKDTLATYYNNRAAAATMILQYEDALVDCNHILTFNPSFVKAYSRKAKILTLIGRLKEAKEVYNQVLQVMNTMNTNEQDVDHTLIRTNSTISTAGAASVNATQEKANIASLQKDLDTLLQRVDLIQKLLKINSDKKLSNSNNSNSDAHVLQELIPLLTIPQSNASQALKQINLILSSSCPQYKDLLPYKLQCYIITQQFNDAYTLSSTLLRSMNNDCMILYYRSYILYRKGLIAETLKHLKQILRMNPDHSLSQKLYKALRSLSQQKDSGDDEYKVGNHQKAVENYTNAISNPICVGLFKSKLLYNRSCSLYYLKSYQDCIQDCNDALLIDDEYVKVYIRRGNALVNLDECTEKDCMNAIQDFEKAMELLERSSSGGGGSSPNNNENRMSSSEEKQMKELKSKIRETQVQIKRLKQKDFYKILNVSRNATQNEIKKSYRKLALQYHPDRQSNKSEEEKMKAEVFFKDVNLAYEVLSDETKKRKYDSGVEVEDLDNPHAGHGHGHGHGGFGGHGGMDPNILFEMFMRQQHGGGMGGMGGGFHFG
jgi:tetratricopeptide (TPR) repeat protein